MVNPPVHSPLLARRPFLLRTATLASGMALSPRLSAYASANDEIRVGFLSCGGRANELMGSFSKVPGLKIVGLCDPDASRVDKAKTRVPDAKTASDLRRIIEDPNIDAVVVATCNHWHCLASIWAMQAGKDVYVEKPLSHSQWEGEQTIAAARKYQRICQVGTQQRSDPMQNELKKFLHEEKALGDIQRVQVNRYGVRGSIGKRSEPLPKDPNIDSDLPLIAPSLETHGTTTGTGTGIPAQAKWATGVSMSWTMFETLYSATRSKSHAGSSEVAAAWSGTTQESPPTCM